MNTCTLPNCDKPAKYKLYCGKHYEWKRLHPGKTVEYKEQLGREVHNMKNSPEYVSWLAMKQRCYNPNNVGYVHYGGRGITVYDQWRKSFVAFYSYIGPRPVGTTLDRIDNNRGYFPGNVRWATGRVQATNTRMKRNNKSGVTGVSWYEREGKWSAELFVSGKRVYSKRFVKLDDAIAARKKAERQYNINAIKT